MSFAGIIREEIEKFKGKEHAVFLTILTYCNHSDNPDFMFNGVNFPLIRGQWVTSLPVIEEKTALTTRGIRTALKNLVTSQIVTDQSTGILTNRARLVTVINIDKYLVKKLEVTDQSTGQTPNGRQTGDRRVTANNKDNKENNENKLYPPEFPVFKKKKEIKIVSYDDDIYPEYEDMSPDAKKNEEIYRSNTLKITE